MIPDTFTISLASQEYLNNTFKLRHHSEIGIKYTSNDDQVKITYSKNINNFLGGRWRMSKNMSPYTLYYANGSVSETVPTSGWISIEGDVFSGVFSDMINISPTPTPTLTVTPTPTIHIPTPTPSPTNVYVDASSLPHNELTETIIVHARPTITHVSNLSIKPNLSYAILITGFSMQYTTSVFLSSNNNTLDEQMYDLWSGYSAIHATKTTYEVISENELIVNTPPLSSGTIIDVIVANPAGYGQIDPEYVNKSTNWTDDNLQHQLITVE